jgi:hypothetical protein
VVYLLLKMNNWTDVPDLLTIPHLKAEVLKLSERGTSPTCSRLSWGCRGLLYSTVMQSNQHVYTIHCEIKQHRKAWGFIDSYVVCFFFPLFLFTFVCQLNYREYKLRRGKELHRGLFSGNLPGFTWRDWGKPQSIFMRIAGMQVDIRKGDRLNTKQLCQLLHSDVQTLRLEVISI